MIPSPTFVFCTSQMQEFRSQRANQRDGMDSKQLARARLNKIPNHSYLKITRQKNLEREYFKPRGK